MIEILFLNEDSRNKLIQKSKSSVKGKQRYNRRSKSKVASNVRQFNSIDMDKLFKDDILTVNIAVKGETDDYTVRISFGGFFEILRDNIEKNNGELNLRAITRALVTGFNKDDVFIHCSCLYPDTKIKLLDGRTVTVEEMLSLFENNEKLFVYSVDDNGDFKPGEVEKVWITDYQDDFIKITLDNGKSITTTPEHLYLTRDGKYKQAQFLSVGQSLFSIDTANNNICNKIILKIEHIRTDKVPVYDIKVKKYPNFLVDAGVILHNCPDFHFRFGFYATKNQINSGEPETRPSDITNPNDTLGSGCKHILLVLSNNSWLMKVASVINNYIKYMEKHYPKAYADIMFPAIYGVKYDKAVQLGMFDDDTLETDADTLDIVNKAGAKSGQFKQSNKQGIRFAKNPEDTKNQQEIDFDEEE